MTANHKPITLSLVAAGFLASTALSPAQASDILTDPSTAYVQGNAAPARANFSGFYIGGAIGYGNANHDLSVRDYFKDYCDSGFYEDADIDDLTPPTLKVGEEQKDESNAFEDLNRFFKFGGDDLENCTPPVTNADLKGGYAPIGVVPGDSREVANLDGLNSTGIVGDFRIGYDQQVGNRFLVGVFGSYGLTSMEADGEIVGVGDFTLERGDDWSIGVRAGALVNDRTLLYILAAYTETEYDLNVTVGPDSFSKTTDFSGVTVGGGVEFALASNVFLGLEGTHTFYDDETILDLYDPASNEGISVHDELGETKVMATIKLKLNSDVFGN